MPLCSSNQGIEKVYACRQFSDVIFQHLNNASSTKCFERVPLAKATANAKDSEVLKKVCGVWVIHLKNYNIFH